MSNDLSDRQQSEDALKVALHYAEHIIATLREPFLVLNGDLRVKTANRSFFESFHVSKEETENRLVYDFGNGQWGIPLLRTLLNEVLSKDHWGNCVPRQASGPVAPALPRVKAQPGRETITDP